MAGTATPGEVPLGKPRMDRARQAGPVMAGLVNAGIGAVRLGMAGQARSAGLAPERLVSARDGMAGVERRGSAGPEWARRGRQTRPDVAGRDWQGAHRGGSARQAWFGADRLARASIGVAGWRGRSERPPLTPTIRLNRACQSQATPAIQRLGPVWWLMTSVVPFNRPPVAARRPAVSRYVPTG